MPHIIFVFVDGVGLGPADEEKNPLAAHHLPAFEKLAGGQAWTQGAAPVGRAGHVFRPIDATLGVEGLPQSGTGQATLFTGVNGAEAAGRHFGPFPHSETKPIIAEKNLFNQVQRLGLPKCGDEPCAFANAYPPRFFRYAERTARWTVTTRAALDAGVRLRSTDLLSQGEALAADLTRAGLRQIGIGASVISEDEAAEHLFRISRHHALTLFEYFLTDKAGHSRDAARAERVLRSLDRFFGGLLERMDPKRDLLLVTSDHGNLEDLSTKSHTRHPVPLIAYGRGARAFRNAEDLTDVVPALLHALADATTDG